MADNGRALTDLAAEWRDSDRLIGCVIPQTQVTAAAVAAARFYAGHGYLAIETPEPAPQPSSQDFQGLNWCAENFIDGFYDMIGYSYGFPLFLPQPPKIVPGSPIAPVDWVDESTLIHQSEWSVIRSLFILYVERENALYQEASRQAGLEVYGRSSDAIAADIERLENDLPKLAACQPIFTI